MRVLLAVIALTFLSFAFAEPSPNHKEKESGNATQNQCSPNISIQCQPGQGNENKPHSEAANAPPAHAGTGTTNEGRIADGTENLTFATWALAGITLFVWMATYGLFRDAKETSRASLRAYVNVTTFDIGNVVDPIFSDPEKKWAREKYLVAIQDPNIGPVAIAYAKNSGKTPALDVVHLGDITFDTFPTPQSKLIVGEAMDKIASVIGPDVVTNRNFKIHQPLNAAQIASLRSGDAAVYVFGTITYKDVFGVAHFTKYRVMYHAMGGGGHVGSHTTLSFCEGGNDTDRDYQKTYSYRFKQWLKAKLTS